MQAAATALGFYIIDIFLKVGKGKLPVLFDADQGSRAHGIRKTDADLQINEPFDIAVVVFNDDLHQLFDLFRFFDHAHEKVFGSEHHCGDREGACDRSTYRNLTAKLFLYHFKAVKNNRKPSVLFHIHQTGFIYGL